MAQVINLPLMSLPQLRQRLNVLIDHLVRTDPESELHWRIHNAIDDVKRRIEAKESEKENVI